MTSKHGESKAVPPCYTRCLAPCDQSSVAEAQRGSITTPKLPAPTATRLTKPPPRRLTKPPPRRLTKAPSRSLTRTSIEWNEATPQMTKKAGPSQPHKYARREGKPHTYAQRDSLEISDKAMACFKWGLLLVAGVSRINCPPSHSILITFTDTFPSHPLSLLARLHRFRCISSSKSPRLRRAAKRALRVHHSPATRRSVAGDRRAGPSTDSIRATSCALDFLMSASLVPCCQSASLICSRTTTTTTRRYLSLRRGRSHGFRHQGR